MAKVRYNREALEKLKDEDLEKIYNDDTVPKLSDVFRFLGRKPKSHEKDKNPKKKEGINK